MHDLPAGQHRVTPRTVNLRAPALVCALRPHGETAVIAHLLTRESGLCAAYVAGGRGRNLRPVLIPGNRVEADLRTRPGGSQLPFARLELLESRGPWLAEPLPAAAIAWVMVLTASALPERQPFPALYDALGGVLQAVCMAPSARGWLPGLLSYERLLLGELGYGPRTPAEEVVDWPDQMARFDRLGALLARYPLAERRGAVMAARGHLRERLARISD